jgi:hypothetical protein
LQAFFVLVGRAGIEPATNGLREGSKKTGCIFNQLLATLAASNKQSQHVQTSLIQ